MLRPFSRFCVRIGAIPASIIKSLSYEEQLIRLVKFLKEVVIPAINSNADAVDELKERMTDLENYVNNYFNNLDVQDEIDNKLDEMVEQGTLQEIIADYLNSKAVFGFDTVADMKEATNLIDGSYTRTLGYYSKNDGGSALYKIREITNDDVVNEKTIIKLSDDTLIAELIIDKELNVLQIGAYGDNTHDDTSTIQFAIDLGVDLYFPKKTYLINNSINLTNKGDDNNNYNFKAENAKFNYTGLNYAINISNVQNANIDIGYILSNNGGNIHMTASSYSDFIQYLNISCKVMKANSSFANVLAETTGDGWINEINFHDGRFYGMSKYGFHIKYGCNNWIFNRIGFEGCETGIYFENSNAEHSMGHFTFNECRHQESITKVIKADGWVKDVFINYPWVVNFYLIDINNTCDNWKVYSVDNTASLLLSGKWYFSKQVKTLEGGLNASDGLDLNDLKTAGDINFVTATAISSASNFPPVTRQGKLTIEKFSNYFNNSDPTVIQTYTSKIGERFTRCFVSNTWRRWMKNSDFCTIALASNDDLNNCNKGSYYCDSHAVKITLSNIPSDLGDIFRMDVILIGDITTTRYQQKIIDTNGNMYSRVYNGSTYTSWVKITTA